MEEGTEPGHPDNAAFFLGLSHKSNSLSPSLRAMVPSLGTQWDRSTQEEPSLSTPRLLAVEPTEKEPDSRFSLFPLSTDLENTLEIDPPLMNAVDIGDVFPNSRLNQSITPPARYERMEKLLFNTKDLCSSAFDHHANSATQFASVELSQEFRLLFLQTRSSFDHGHPHQERLSTTTA